MKQTFFVMNTFIQNLKSTITEKTYFMYVLKPVLRNLSQVIHILIELTFIAKNRNLKFA